jgi:hypothetical protein
VSRFLLPFGAGNSVPPSGTAGVTTGSDVQPLKQKKELDRPMQ